MNGLTIPKWALVAGGLLVAVVGATWGAAEKVADARAEMKDARARLQIVDLRLCRIEAALGIDPWPTCPEQRRTP